MFAIDTDKTISITRGDVCEFTAPVEYDFQSGDVVRFKVFRKKACEDVVLCEDFRIESATKSVTITLTEENTRIGGVISKPTVYWYEIELNPETNPQTILGYDEDGAKIFMLYPEGRDIEDDELTKEEYETHRKLLDEFRGDIPKEVQDYLDENIGSIAAEVEKFADFEKKANKLTEYKEDATDDNYYSAKAVNDMFMGVNETLEDIKEELQGDIDDISMLVGGAE